MQVLVESKAEQEYLDRIAELEAALKPLADIADEYDSDGLDQCRPDWVKRGVEKFNPNEELFCGRGGKQLLVLGDALRARDVLRRITSSVPEVDSFIIKVIQIYNAGLPKAPWESLSVAFQNDLIEKYRKILA